MTQCTNHMKQFGIAIHTAHGVKKALVPYTLGSDRTTFFLLILPFMEQESIYLFAEGATGNGIGRSFAATGDNWNGIFNSDEDFKKGVCSISFQYCPTRRPASGTPTNSYEAAGDPGVPTTKRMGPATDYVLCAAWTQATDQNTSHNAIWNCHNNNPTGSPSPDSLIGAQDRGPFRAAVIVGTTDADYRAYKERDDFSWWQDGTSNQLIMGEKYIAHNFLYDSQLDSTWLYANNTTWCGAIRGAYHDLARNIPGVLEANSGGTNLGHPRNVGNGHYLFGAWHAGGNINFLIGDGAVRALAPTTHKDRIVFPLINVSDGKTVEFPGR